MHSYLDSSLPTAHQVRLDAFGLLCEHPKTTEVISEQDLMLVRHFLPLNMDSQAPAFRQHITAFIKKVVISGKLASGEKTSS